MQHRLWMHWAVAFVAGASFNEARERDDFRRGYNMGFRHGKWKARRPESQLRPFTEK